jgi:hypothetical protein
MLLNELVEMVGKMPTKVCADMNIVGGILPTLPRMRQHQAHTTERPSCGSVPGLTLNTGPYYFDGSVDDVRIYDRALSIEKISAIKNLME